MNPPTSLTPDVSVKCQARVLDLLGCTLATASVFCHGAVIADQSTNRRVTCLESCVAALVDANRTAKSRFGATHTLAKFIVFDPA